MGLTDKIKDKFAKDSPEEKEQQRLEHEALHESNRTGRLSGTHHVPTSGTHYTPGTATTTDNAYGAGGLHNNPNSPNRVPVGGNTYSHNPALSTTTNTNTHTTISGGRHSPTVPGAYPQQHTGTHIPGTHTVIPGTASHNTTGVPQTGTHVPVTRTVVPGTASHNTTGTHVPGTALGAGAASVGTAGYAAHEHGHHNSAFGDKTHANRPIDPYSSSGQQTAATSVGEHDRLNHNRNVGFAETGDLKTGPHSRLENPTAIPVAGGERVGSNVDDDAPMGSTHQHNQHHYGRDAGIVGAGGLGAHELSKDHHNRDSRDNRDNYNDQNEKPSTGEKIKSALLPGHNSNDKRSNSKDRTNTHSNTHSSPTHATHTYTGDKLRSDVPHESQHHYGRDAAIVGGTGALGAGAYETEKHHNDRDHDRRISSQQHNQTGYNDYNDKPTMGEKIKSALPGNNDNTTSSSNYPNQHHDSSFNSNSPTTNQHHYGRDAGIVGGAGALGAGAYGAEKHHHGRHSPTGRRLNELDDRSRYQSNPSGASQAYTTGPVNPSTHDHHNTTSTHDHHYGRDAAVAGGVGAGGVGAYELGKDRRHSPSGRHSNQDYDNDYNNNNNKPSTGEKIKSALLPGHNKDKDSSDYNNNNTSNTNRDYSTTGTHNQTQHHTGRDAALGAGALGAGGATIHHHDHNNNQGLGHNKHDSATGNTGISGRMPTQKQAVAAVPDMPTDWTLAKKLGGAYEAGYRDAVEHMREEMQKTRV